MARPSNVKLRLDTSQGKTIIASWTWSATHTESFIVQWVYADELGVWKRNTYHKLDPVTVSAKSSISIGTVVTCLSDGAAIWSSKESSATILERVAFGTDLELVNLDSEYCVVKTSSGETGYIYSKYCSSSKTQYQAAPREATLSIPDNAARVWVFITPISETYTINSTDADGNQLNSAEVFYWQAEESTGVGIWVLNLQEPPTPSAPTITLSDDGTYLTATVKGIDIGTVSTSPDERPQVCFIIKRATAEGVPSDASNAQIDHGVVNVSTDGIATFVTRKIVAGESYCAMARVGIYHNTALASNGNWNASSYELWWGEWSEASEAVKTKPGSFSLVNVRASSSTGVTITWNASPGAESYEIYYTSGTDELSGMQILQNPDAYSSSLYQTVTEISKSVTQYTLAGLTTGARYYFRMKAVNDAGETYSLPGNILQVAIGEKPSPPSTWSYSYTAKLGDIVDLYFSHNSADNSKCSKYKIHYSIYLSDGTASDEYDSIVTLPEASSDDDSTIIKATLDTSQWTSDVSVKWKVATAGVTGEYSDWSVERTLNVYKVPVIVTSLVANSELGEDGVTYDIKSFPIRINGQIEAGLQYPTGVRLTVTSLEAYTSVDFQGRPITVPANTQIYSKSYYNDWRQWHLAMVTMTLLPMQISLKNNVRYRIDIVASMSSGLTASQSYTIHTAWDSQEMIPEASIGYNSAFYCTYIRPRCRDINGNYFNDVTMSVYRRDYDGDFVEVAAGVSSELNATVTDPHPSLNFVSYRIVAVSNETGEIAYVDTQNFKVGVHAIVVQWDDEWKEFDVVDGMASEQPWIGSMLVLPYNIDTSDSTSPDASLVEYAGRSHPVSYYGTHQGTSSTWNTDIPKRDLDTLFQIRRLQAYRGDVYVREPTGVGYWANITVNYNIKHCELTVPITFNIKRVETPAARTSNTEDHEFIKTDTVGDLQNVLMTI
jgi:hypothetical protein